MWARVQEEYEKGGVHVAGALGEAHTEGSVSGGGGGGEQRAPRLDGIMPHGAGSTKTTLLAPV